jgi:HD-GYP domain-containing protein (c-di-GMP phosphodiesterase class II)
MDHHSNDFAKGSEGGLNPSEEALDALAQLESRLDPKNHAPLVDRLRHAIEHLDEHSERAYIVAKCAMELVEARSPVEVLHATLQEAIRLTKAERGYILMWDEKLQRLDPVGLEDMKVSPDELAICNNLAKTAFDQGRVIFNPDLDPDGVACGCTLDGAEQVRSVLVAPLIAETGKSRQVLGVVYLDTRKENHLFVEDDAKLMQSFAALAALSIAHLRATQQLRNAYRETVEALVRALEAKDKYTRGHSERVAEYSLRCGRLMGLSDDRLIMLHSAGLLHDVGKIGIRDAVLFKPGKLTKEEYEHIKLHAELSETIVRGLSFLEEELNILAGSQEHYDGTGYPRGTKGDEIPIESYIIQVADAWDAMTSTRVYRLALTRDQSESELRKFSGSQFHPKVVDSFLAMIDRDGLITE